MGSELDIEDRPERIVFFDLETGGLDPLRHPITQIAMIAVDRNLEELERYTARVLFKEENADPVALKLNHYDRELWAKEGKDPRVVCVEVKEFMERHASVYRIAKKSGKPFFSCRMAGHNAAKFDSPFLREWFKRLGQWCPMDLHCMDTLHLGLWYFCTQTDEYPESMALGVLAVALGVDEGKAHDALSDVLTTIGVARAILKRGLRHDG